MIILGDLLNNLVEDTKNNNGVGIIGEITRISRKRYKYKKNVTEMFRRK